MYICFTFSISHGGNTSDKYGSWKREQKLQADESTTGG